MTNRKGPRILLYDLETSHNIVASFRLYGEDYIPYENILQERYTICAAWKWLGEREVYSAVSYTKDDREVLKAVAAAVQEADVVVAHNGDDYDTKWLAARLVANGMKPAMPARSIDTKKVAKRVFLFNSNRLDYLGKFLGVGHKTSHTTGLWLRALRGDKKAIDAIARYNKGDVRLLERVFLKLRPWMPDYVNREVDGELKCPRCGSRHVVRQGLRHTTTRSYQQYQCQQCGGWLRAVKSEKSPAAKYRVL